MREADWLQAPESGAGRRHAACVCWLQPRVGWVRCQWHSQANLTDESPFQFLPFMSNQMTRGWRDKLSDAPYPGGAWRQVLPVQHLCNPANTTAEHPLDAAQQRQCPPPLHLPPALKYPSAHSNSPFHRLTAASSMEQSSYSTA